MGSAGSTEANEALGKDETVVNVLDTIEVANKFDIWMVSCYLKIYLVFDSPQMNTYKIINIKCRFVTTTSHSLQGRKIKITCYAVGGRFSLECQHG